jgi:hypothetical protein
MTADKGISVEFQEFLRDVLCRNITEGVWYGICIKRAIPKNGRSSIIHTSEFWKTLDLGVKRGDL